MAVKSPRYWKTAADQTVTWTHIPDHPKSSWNAFGIIECTGCLASRGHNPKNMLSAGDAAEHAAVCREVQKP